MSVYFSCRLEKSNAHTYRLLLVKDLASRLRDLSVTASSVGVAASAAKNDILAQLCEIVNTPHRSFFVPAFATLRSAIRGACANKNERANSAGNPGICQQVFRETFIQPRRQSTTCTMGCDVSSRYNSSSCSRLDARTVQVQLR